MKQLSIILLLACLMPVERLAADTPNQTVLGNTFIAPAGWTVTVRGPATILEAPEGDSRIALVDVTAPGRRRRGGGGVGRLPARRASGRSRSPPTTPTRTAGRSIRDYNYQMSPNERRDVVANARRAGGNWTVVDLRHGASGRREARRAGGARLRPPAARRGTSARRSPARRRTCSTPARSPRSTAFVETGRKALGVPGVSVGIVQDGKVVFADGFGVRELGEHERPDGDTMYMIASNTKALTTLMLAQAGRREASSPGRRR